MKTEYVCTFLMVVLFLTVPWLANVMAPRATLMILMAACVVLSLVAGIFGKTRGRILVPVTIGIAFLFTAPFFYSESVLIWGLWLGVVSAVCVAVGWGISALAARGRGEGRPKAAAQEKSAKAAAGTSPVRPPSR